MLISVSLRSPCTEGSPSSASTATFWRPVLGTGVPFSNADHLVWDTFTVFGCFYLRVNEFMVIEREKMFRNPVTYVGRL